VRVSLVKDETVESLVRTLAEHLASWGGRPLLCVFDRPKTIAVKWRKNGEVTEWNPVFAYATLGGAVLGQRGTLVRCELPRMLGFIPPRHDPRSMPLVKNHVRKQLG
jgi:hypothetical protein